MNKLLVSTAVAALLAGGACSKGQPVNSPSSASIATGEEYQAPDDRSVWAQGWDAISRGGKAVANAGKWTFEKAKDGALIVGHGTKKVAGKVASETGDAAVHAEVKARLAANKSIESSRINIDVDQGDVTLRGQVRSPDEASEAVRTALDTQGVDRVLSYLTW